MAFSIAEKNEYDRLRKKLNHYWLAKLEPFEASLRDLDIIAKEVAIEDFYQLQEDYKPSDEEIERLKVLAHQDPQYDPLLSGDLLTIEKFELQISNALQL